MTTHSLKQSEPIAAKLLARLRACLSERTVAVLCAVMVVLLVAPLIAMSFHAYPTHDDFPSVSNAARVWAQTGDFGAVLKAAWQSAVSDYYTWQGTFVAMFICAFQPMAISMKLFWITPALTLVLLCLSAWYMVWQLTGRLLKANGSICIIVYAALMMLLLGYVPGIRELVYWQSAVQYTYSVIMLMFLIGLLVRLHLGCGCIGYALRTLASFVCAVMIGGLPYPLALGITMGMLLVAVWCFLRRSPARWASLISFIGILAALIVVVIAPGNTVRQNRVGDSMEPVAAIVHSIIECLSCTADWFGPQLIGVVMLIAPFLWRTLKASGLSFRNPGWFSLFSFGTLAASFVPAIYATGVDGYKLDRIIGSLYWLYAVLVFLNMLYWLGWWARHSTASPKRGMPVWRLALCFGALAWGLFASGAVLATPTPGAYYSLLSGEAKRHQSEITARQKAITAAQTLEEVNQAIVPLSVQPAVLPLDKLIYQIDTALPAQIHHFFSMQALTERYGAGHIPPSEWEKLDVWLN